MRWPWPRPLPRRPAVRRPDLQRPAAAAPDDDAPPLGCGWFDSSHELRCGLEVQEIPVRWVVTAQELLGDRRVPYSLKA